ncbi:cobalamin biosynthesis protein [Neisseria meningitidis]|nr:cobalamin biosynthesis protein [Neisseria meningitidis]MBG8856878.1 cobalamin biosynthesis protein [Neisseria meningitidis]MBG8865226.1 cobalamin biosynthesis protein [Neisseria meningitidis]MBG8867303.1 cobalamin biosynthesis protein [Neisseria meningitidis]MBG8869457.1 cobalamin biosynthesis protein [Neisseria meningitidis]
MVRVSCIGVAVFDSNTVRTGFRTAVFVLFVRGGTLQTAYCRRYFGGCGPPEMYLLVLRYFVSNPHMENRLRFGIVPENRQD